MVICLPDFQSAKATEGGFMRRMLYSYVPASDEWSEEYSRRLHGSVTAREKHAFRCWNGFLKWPEPVSQKENAEGNAP